MKKFLTTFILGIFLSLSVAFGQGSKTFTEHNGDWYKTAEAYCGVGEFWLATVKHTSTDPNLAGYYVYEVWITSNSYYTNCNKANTFIEEINITYQDPSSKIWYYPSGFDAFDAIVGESQVVYYIISASPNLPIKISWDSAKPY